MANLSNIKYSNSNYNPIQQHQLKGIITYYTSVTRPEMEEMVEEIVSETIDGQIEDIVSEKVEEVTTEKIREIIPEEIKMGSGNSIDTIDMDEDGKLVVTKKQIAVINDEDETITIN